MSPTSPSRTFPISVELQWRRYGKDIEMRLRMSPEGGLSGADFGVEDLGIPMFGWVRCRREDGETLRCLLARKSFEMGSALASLINGRALARINTVTAVKVSGRRKPPTRASGVAETGGELALPQGIIRFGGACPVQGRGELDGHPCYYRAKGDGWSFDVWPKDAAFDDSGDMPSGTPLFRYEQNEVYAAPDGGWLHHTVTKTNLREAVEAWTKQLTP